MSRIVRPAATVEYPSGDGQPMAENDWQLHAILVSGAVDSRRPALIADAMARVCAGVGAAPVYRVPTSTPA